MSTTPISSKPQQKKVQSAKKVSAKGLKNVLARPDENFWPLLKNDPGAGLENLLKSSLPPLKNDKKRAPWSQICKMNKEERAAANKAAKTECNTDLEAIVKSKVLGINATTKLLEKNDACCILLDGTVDSMMLIKHVVVMAGSKGVPILIVPFLKKVTLQTIGFPCAAIGLKNQVKDSSNHFNALYNKVQEMSLEFTKSTVVNVTDDNAVTLQEKETNVKKEIRPCIVSSDLYLYRKSTNERIFCPAHTSKAPQKTEDVQNREFITLGNFNGNEDVEESGVHSKIYHSLRVKRLKGNENRKKSGKLKVKK